MRNISTSFSVGFVKNLEPLVETPILFVRLGGTRIQNDKKVLSQLEGHVIHWREECIALHICTGEHQSGNFGIDGRDDPSFVQSCWHRDPINRLQWLHRRNNIAFTIN